MVGAASALVAHFAAGLTTTDIEAVRDAISNVMISGSNPASADRKLTPSVLNLTSKPGISTLGSHQYMIVRNFVTVKAEHKNKVVDIHFEQKNG